MCSMYVDYWACSTSVPLTTDFTTTLANCPFWQNSFSHETETMLCYYRCCSEVVITAKVLVDFCYFFTEDWGKKKKEKKIPAPLCLPVFFFSEKSLETEGETLNQGIPKKFWWQQINFFGAGTLDEVRTSCNFSRRWQRIRNTVCTIMGFDLCFSSCHRLTPNC